MSGDDPKSNDDDATGRDPYDRACFRVRVRVTI